MVTYMTMPTNKLTLGSTELTDTILSAKIIRNENGFDTATFVLPSTSYYPTTVTQGTTVLFEVKDRSDSSYTTLFAGTARFVTANISDSNSLTVNCLSIGAGLSEMVVAADYGDQSVNGLDSITEILTDSTYGIIPKYVEKILASATGSNYAFDTTNVATISDNITYINFPYKPADKAILDLCDLTTAVRAGSSGPHWIVTYSGGTNYLRVKYVDGTQTGWTKYYGNSQANATLTYGVDYTDINLEQLSPEANYIIYYGAWRRPSNGDYWTENNATAWGAQDATIADDSTAGNFKINTAAIKITGTSGANPAVGYYPSTTDLGIDLTYFQDFNIPSLNFWIKRGANMNCTVYLVDSSANDFSYILYNSGTGAGPVQTAGTWYHISLPVGFHFKVPGQDTWTDGGGDWSDIQYITFTGSAVVGGTLHVDGLHFGDANVCRIAALTDYTGVITRQRLIVDDVGKDDSLIDDDDSGLMAQLAYSELLRLRTTALVGTVITPMIKDLLPGQWLYVQSTDYRVTKITQLIEGNTYISNIDVTSDTKNSRPRSRFEDLNKQFAAIRPEWQDRQASNIKAGGVDWRVTRLTETYT
jgi:hypothetical protein